MDRISTATKAVDLFGAGKHGFKDGNLALAIQPTDLDAAWFNDLQEEAVGIIEAAGLVPTAGNRTQLRQAIEILIARATGNDYKTSVRVATTANIAALAGGAPNAVDGVALAANDRVLVKDQATGSQNGIYVVTTLGTGANGTWTRAADADQDGELTSGALVTVEVGTANTDSLWMLTTDGTIIIGTTSLTFTRKDGSNGLDTTRIDVASAATVDLGVSAPNTRHINITGGTAITGFTVAAGRTYFTRFNASLTLTNGAGLVTQTGANIVTQAGDTCILRATAANVVEVLAYVPAILNQQTTRSMIRLNTGNGHGSTNTMIRRFANVVANQGSDITYADSATLGATFTINTPGVYAISYTDAFGTQIHFGLSLNSSQLTTSILNITTADCLVSAFTTAVNNESETSWAGFLPAGSVIRAHTDGAANASLAAITKFTISRVA